MTGTGAGRARGGFMAGEGMSAEQVERCRPRAHPLLADVVRLARLDKLSPPKVAGIARKRCEV